MKIQYQIVSANIKRSMIVGISGGIHTFWGIPPTFFDFTGYDYSKQACCFETIQIRVEI
jgi:hypothetical protein